MEFENVVTLHNSGESIETAVMVGEKESHKVGLTQVLADTLIPKPSSKQSFEACQPAVKAIAKFAKESPEDTITVYQKDYNGEWQMVKQIQRGNLADYVNQVCEFHKMLSGLNRHVTEYNPQLKNPADFKKRGKRKASGFDESVFEGI